MTPRTQCQRTSRRSLWDRQPSLQTCHQRCPVENAQPRCHQGSVSDPESCSLERGTQDGSHRCGRGHAGADVPAWPLGRGQRGSWTTVWPYLRKEGAATCHPTLQAFTQEEQAGPGRPAHSAHRSASNSKPPVMAARPLARVGSQARQPEGQGVTRHGSRIDQEWPHGAEATPTTRSSRTLFA